MGLNDEIRAATQRPTYKVKVGGYELNQVESIVIDRDFDQASGTCTVTCPKKWPVEPNDLIEVRQGYGGYNRKTFTGYVDDVDKETFPKYMIIRARDVLKRAIENFIVDEIEYDSMQAEDVVADLLGRSGIDNYTLDTTNFTIGDVEPAKFSLISAMDAIRSIADLIGWRCWAESNGMVIFRKVYPRGAATYRWLYTKDPTFGDESGIIHIDRLATDIDLRNWIEVWGWTNPATGETIKATAYADSPYVPDPPRYRKAVISNEIIDTQAMAEWIAERVLGDLNQIVDRADGTVQGNPRIHIGNTVRIVEDWTDTSSGVNFFVYGISSEMRGEGLYQMTLTLVGGRYVPPSPIEEDLSPVASFEVKQVGWGDPTWVIYVDASASYDPDGEIVGYDFDWGDGTTHGTQMIDNHVYSSGSFGDQFTITLTVTDNDGYTGEASKTITLGSSGSGAGVYDRVLYFADDTGEAFGTPDSGNNWNSFSCGAAVNCVSAQDAQEGYAWFGCENGRVYKSLDYCVSGTLVHTFGSAVRSIWIDRVYPEVIFVGLLDGKVYRTTDEGASWVLLYTFAEGPIWNVFCEPGDVNHIHCSGGTTTGYWYESTDGGVSWTNHGALWSGIEVVRDHAWQFFQYYNAACQTDPASIKRSEDDGATWLDCTGYSESLMRTITASPFDPLVVLAGGESAVLVYRTTSGSTFSTSGSVVNGTKVTRLRFDGELWGTVFGGTDVDLEISFDLGSTWKQLYDSPGLVMDIAQGPLLEVKPGEGTVMIATPNGPYRTDEWTGPSPAWIQKISGLGDIDCNDLIKHPFQEHTYLLLTTDGLYRSEDDGDTWVQNTNIPAPDASGRTPQYMAICYGASDGTFYVSYTAIGAIGNSRAYLLKTEDDGVTWDQLYLPGGWPIDEDSIASATRLCVSLQDDNLAYVAGTGGAGRPKSWKVNWDTSTVTTLIYYSRVASNYMNVHSPRNQDDYIWVFGNWGGVNYFNVQRSLDEGLSWTVGWSGTNAVVQALCSHYMNYMDLVANCQQSLYESTGGLSWTLLCNLPDYVANGGTGGAISCIARKPTDIDYIVLGTRIAEEGYPCKILMTPDRGVTWEDKTGDLAHDVGAIRAIVCAAWNEDVCSAGPSL